MKAKLGLLPFLITSALATHASASEVGEVCYSPAHGSALTSCVPEFDTDGNMLQPCPEMLGQYRVVLKKTSADRENRRLRIAGPMRGVNNPDQTLNHVLADEQAKGLIYTSGDTLVEVTPLSDCLLQIKEELYVVFGTGKYAGAHGTLTVTGQLNPCTGVNDLDLVRNEGEICFNESALKHDHDD